MSARCALRLLIAVPALTLVFACGSDVVETSGNGRSVLLVTFDTTRADRVGCYGYEEARTPRLDTLAADGVRFDQAQSTSALTAMAHASILTGLNPHRHGLRIFYGPLGHYLEENHRTLAGVLRAEGYSTAGFVSAWTASSGYGLHHGFDVFDSGLDMEELRAQDESLHVRDTNRWRAETMGQGQRRGDATNELALEWLRTNEGPFFLWVHYFDVHDPTLIPPPEFTEAWGLDIEKISRRRAGRVRMYDPELAYMDGLLGDLLDELDSSGRAANTVVCVMSDHGQGLNDHDWYLHRLLYQEQIRIPLLMRGPGVPSGSVVQGLVRNIDVYPTLLDLLDLAVPPALDEKGGPIDGISLVPLMHGRGKGAAFAIAEALNALDTHNNNALPDHQKDLLFSITDGRWKLIHHQEFPENSELYDLETDPRESHNLLAERPAEAARLLRALDEAGAREMQLIDAGPEDESIERRLEAIGYGGEE